MAKLRPIDPIATRKFDAGMCNDYEQHIAWKAYCEMLRKLELGIPMRESEDDLPRADDIRINDVGPVMRAGGNVIELKPMTFGFPPARSWSREFPIRLLTSASPLQ